MFWVIFTVVGELCGKYNWWGEFTHDAMSLYEKVYKDGKYNYASEYLYKCN